MCFCDYVYLAGMNLLVQVLCISSRYECVSVIVYISQV